MMTNDQLIERFAREYQCFHQISEKRQREQRKMVRVLAAQIAPRGLMETDASDLNEFMGRWLDAGQHPNTARKKANMVRAFFSWAYATRLYSPDRFVRLKQAKPPRGSSNRSLPNPYSPAEIREFYAALDNRLQVRVSDVNITVRNWIKGRTSFERVFPHAMKLQIEAIVALALHNGLRREEIYRLSLLDLHHDNEYVVVQRAAKNRAGTSWTQDVPYSRAARDAVRAWLEVRQVFRPDHDRPWLGLTGHGERSRPMPFHSTFELLLVHYVGPRWELRRFRHTCGTERLRAGMPLEKVSRLLGHSNIEQTLGYAEIVKSDIYKDMARSDDAFERRVGRQAA